MKYLAKEESPWPTSKGGFNSLEEAIERAESNLSGKWAIWEEGFIPKDPVYKNY